MTDELKIYSVIPAYPYEGALYWMFEQDRSNPERLTSKPYYQGLFEVHANEKSFRSKAVAAMCLFDQMFLAGADAYIPRGLQNKSVRAYILEDDDGDWRDRRKAVTKMLLDTPAVGDFMKRHNRVLMEKSHFEFFANRALFHLAAAKVQDAVILGGDIFAEFCELLDMNINALSDVLPLLPSFPCNIVVDPNHLDVYGINFSPADLDAFINVRSDTAITEYAHSFCEALLEISNPVEREREFVQAIRTAMDREAVSRRAAGVLETTATACGVAGLVPILGTVLGIGGLAADAGARSAKLAERKAGWFLVGLRMQEVAMRDFVQRKANIGT